MIADFRGLKIKKLRKGICHFVSRDIKNTAYPEGVHISVQEFICKCERNLFRFLRALEN